MSFDATKAVMASDLRPPSLKLAAASFAHLLSDTTCQLNPSVATIGRYCGGITACQARRLIHQLIDMGILEVIGNHSGGKPTSTRSYALNLDRLSPSLERATTSTGATPGADAPDPSHGCAPPLAPVRATTSTDASQTKDEQRMNKVVNKEGASKRLKASKRCPDDFQVTTEMLEWAEQKCPHVDVDLQTEVFRNHEFKDAKTDWPAAWRNWMLRNISGHQLPQAHSRIPKHKHFAGSGPIFTESPPETIDACH